jgi:hypothetical protein
MHFFQILSITPLHTYESMQYGYVTLPLKTVVYLQRKRTTKSYYF